jgi:hypothetical protein
LSAHNGQELAIYDQILGWKPQASFIEYMHIKDTLEEKNHDLIEKAGF